MFMFYVAINVFDRVLEVFRHVSNSLGQFQVNFSVFFKVSIAITLHFTIA